MNYKCGFFVRSNRLNSMNIVIQKLYKLQQIEMGPNPETPENQEIIKKLREEIPIQIIGHYDRLRAKGKEGVARVRNGVCMGCKMRLTVADYHAVKSGDDISVCQTCARYLIYLPEDEEENQSAIPAPEPIKQTKSVTPAPESIKQNKPAVLAEPLATDASPKKRVRKTKVAKRKKPVK